MAGNRSADENIILLRKYLHDLEALHLYAVAAHPARHTHALHDPAGIGGVTQRTRSTLPVMLTMALLAYAMEPVTLDDALKTFTLGRADNLYVLTFGEDVHGNGFT